MKRQPLKFVEPPSKAMDWLQAWVSSQDPDAPYHPNLTTRGWYICRHTPTGSSPIKRGGSLIHTIEQCEAMNLELGFQPNARRVLWEQEAQP